MRALVLLVPLAVGFGAAVLVSHLLGHPHGALRLTLFWVAVIGASTVAVVLTDAEARRLLPLAALLRLSLVFPDKAPSRFAVALRAGSVGRLRDRALAAGEADSAADAARQILILAAALARHDTATRGHSERVRAYTDLLADELGLAEGDADRLRWSALLHDVGKLAVDHDVLNKHEPLGEADWEAVRRHPDEGARIAKPLRGWLGPWALAIAQHHERWDGSGYPRGLAGKKISRAARIVAVADAFDVMTAARTYKRPVRPEAARQELAACAGRDFDPDVVRAFLDVSLGRLRWGLGLAGVFALPLMPRNVRQTVGNTAAGGLAALAALTAGLLPLGATAATTHVLGESFSRQPEAAAPAPDAPPAPTATGPAFAPVESTTTTTAPRTTASHPANSRPTTTTTTASPPKPRPSPAQKVAVDDVVLSPVKGPIRIDVLANDREPGGTLDRHSVSILDPPRHGTATADSDGRIHYIPASGYTGPDAFVYSVCDVAGRCFSAQVTLIVAAR